MEDGLISDDLLPLDSSVLNLDAPEEQVKELNEERAMVQSGMALLDEIIGWMGVDLTSLDSISGLDLESNVDLKAQLIGREIAKTYLEATRERLVLLRNEYTKD